MDERTQERMAVNEDLFRRINENVDVIALSHGRDEHRYEFFCECADVSCIERISLTLKEYTEARADPRRFVVLPGHAIGYPVERVLRNAGDHLVIEKVGAAGRAAAELAEERKT